MTHLRYITLTFALLFWPIAIFAQHLSEEDILVVTSVQSADLSLLQIKKTYLGMNSSGLANKHAVTLPHGNKTRQLFHVKVIGLSEARVRTFWAQMQFSGRGKSPVELPTVALVIEYLITHPNSIGYLPATTLLPQQLKVIYPVHLY